MYPHSFLWHYLWIAPHALQIIIVVVMIQRRLFREFPIFFTYTVFQIVEQGTLFVLDHSPAVSDYQYWYVHWVISIISIALRFGILWEIFSNIFRNYPGLQQLNRVLFRSAIAVLLLLATMVAARAPEDGTPHIFSGVHVLDLSVDVMQSACGCSWSGSVPISGFPGVALHMASRSVWEFFRRSIWHAGLDWVCGRVRVRFHQHGDLPFVRNHLAGVPVGARDSTQDSAGIAGK